IAIRGGTADRGEMVRVDVFREVDKRGRTRFHMVPIYPHEPVNLNAPPNRAVVGGGKPDEGWKEMDASCDFMFSLFQNSFLELEKPDGTVISGYFKGLDRNTGAISVAASISQHQVARGIGPRNLRSFRKLTIDRRNRGKSSGGWLRLDGRGSG
ncbi:MAG: hypothetical protein JOZ35_04365, partial [Hyphomicrobiales bacterium]|nr:hypothetical protein [Hyphomicrobiales bacterium]